MHVEKKHILITCIVLAVVAVCWYVFRQPRDGTEDAINTSIDRLADEHRRIGDSINRAGERIDSSLGRVEKLEEFNLEAERTTDSIADRVDRCKERNKECKRIIGKSKSRIAEYYKICEGH